jgi:hypothetical protein
VSAVFRKEQLLGIGRQVLWSFLIIFIWSGALGVAVAASMRIYDRGIASHSLVSGAETLAFGLIVLVIIRELRRLGENFARIACGIFLSLVSLFLFESTRVCALQAIPDPALLYWQIWRSYIESHWKTDPVSGVIYFPIDYPTMNDSGVQMGGIFPRNFFVFDKDGTFSIDKSYGRDRLISPSCPGAKYGARRVEDKIYVVRLYVDYPEEDSNPCLVTPTPKQGR